MNSIVFFVEKVPDADHIASHIYRLKDSEYNIFIAGFITDSRINDPVFLELSKYPNVNIIKRLSRCLYSNRFSFIIALITFYLGRLTSKFNMRILCLFFNQLHDINFRRNQNQHYFSQFNQCLVCCDHWCSLNEPACLADTIIKNSRFRVALPHSYHYIDHPTKYLKSFQSFKHTWADIVGFYGDNHLALVREQNTNLADKLFICDHPRYSDSYYKFRFSLLKDQRSINSEKIVVFDTPFLENAYLASLREIWLSTLSQHFQVLLIPHPRSNKLRTGTSITKSDASLYELLLNYTYFVGIWSTISIDMSLHNKVYITCPYLRPPGYYILDENLGATLTVSSNNELVSLLSRKPTPPISQQKQFIDLLFPDGR